MAAAFYQKLRPKAGTVDDMAALLRQQWMPPYI